VAEFLFLDDGLLDQKLPLRSLFYAEGVFETFRWKGSPPVFLDKHLGRMKHGAELIGIPFPGEKSLKDAVERAAGRSKIADAHVKLCLLSSGPLKFYERSDGGRVLVSVNEYNPPKEYMRGHVTPSKRLSTSPLLGIKSLNYLENVLARRRAESRGYDEAIFLNERDEVTEGSATNIFWVKDGVLHTPGVECGLLPGITRGALISVAPELGFEVKEGRFGLNDVLTSQGAFFTNSLIGIAALAEVDKAGIIVNGGLFTKLRGALFETLEWL
jgi:4-amino-4-deoxychorismate lyase